MADIIPIALSDPNQEFSAQLDGVEFVFRVLWNSVDESWYLELYTSDLRPVLLGQKICVGVPLLIDCSSTLKPAGELIAIDTENTDIDPGLDDFGEDPARVQLVYLTAEDVEAGE
jgi:hypothetical protein